MKYLKILGLAAVAALALMALGAAASASATVLCKNKTTTEGCSEVYSIGTKVGVATTGLWVLENKTEPGKIIDECQSAKFELETENTGKEGESVFSSVEPAKYSFAKCNFPVAVTVGGKYEFEWLAGTDNGTLRLSKFEIRVEGLINCLWRVFGEPSMGTVFGGAPATISSTNVFLTRSNGGIACPEQLTMRAPYQITAPSPLYVAKK